MSSVKLNEQIPHHGANNGAMVAPELILNNFDTMLGSRLGRMLATTMGFATVAACSAAARESTASSAGRGTSIRGGGGRRQYELCLRERRRGGQH